MVFVIPEGNDADPTRSPDYYDNTFSYLSGLGIPPFEQFEPHKVTDILAEEKTF